jgi:hypothetical protein
MTSIDRRMLLTRGAIGGAVLTLTSGAAFALTGEDAELLRLWEEWKAQSARCGEANKIYSDAEEKVFDEIPPRWSFASIEFFPYRALFVSSRDGKDQLLVRSLPAKSVEEAHQLKHELEAELVSERERGERAAKRRHKYAAAERGDKLAARQLSAIEDRIAETPAEGIKGVLVKLALWRFWHSGASDEHELLLSAYDDGGSRQCRPRGASREVVRTCRA